MRDLPIPTIEERVAEFWDLIDSLEEKYGTIAPKKALIIFLKEVLEVESDSAYDTGKEVGIHNERDRVLLVLREKYRATGNELFNELSNEIKNKATQVAL